MLMDHPDARRDRVLRRMKTARAPSDLDMPAVRRFQAVEYPHERRLTRAVFTQHSMYFAVTQIEVYVDVGVDGP